MMWCKLLPEAMRKKLIGRLERGLRKAGLQYRKEHCEDKCKTNEHGLEINPGVSAKVPNFFTNIVLYKYSGGGYGARR